jgi:hypothetical protein
MSPSFLIIVKSGNYVKIFSSKGVVRFHWPSPYSSIGPDYSLCRARVEDHGHGSVG